MKCTRHNSVLRPAVTSTLSIRTTVEPPAIMATNVQVTDGLKININLCKMYTMYQIFKDVLYSTVSYYWLFIE